MNNNSLILIKTNIVCNFKPKTNKFLDNINCNYPYSYKNEKKKVFLINFFVFILLLKYKSEIFKNTSIFIKRFKRKIFSILRAPYRHKLSRHQINIERYKINYNIKIKLKNTIDFSNSKKIILFIIFLKNFNLFFESNFIYINNIKIQFAFKYKNNFNIF